MHLPKRLAVVITVMGFLFGVAGCPTSREAKIPTKTYDLPDGPEKVGGPAIQHCEKCFSAGPRAS